MKKRVELQLIIIGIFLLVILLNSVDAIVGVSPGRYELDFEPKLKRDFSFRFLFDSGVESEVYAEGDLAEYVKLSTNSLTGGGGVIASLDLPYNIDVPGNHGILIGARQKVNPGQGFGLVGNVKGIIVVKVPYPGKYADAVLEANNANPGEPINFRVIVHNLGKEDIAASVLIDIYDSSNNSLEKLSLGNSFIENTKSHDFIIQLNTSNYKSGDYRAIAVVDYGAEQIRLEKTFKIGKLFIGIFNYTQDFERGKINRMEIETMSFWNHQIQGLHASVVILNYSISLLTPSTTIEPWSRTVLTGFFDTSEIKEDRFKANMSLYYDGYVTSEIVDLRFKEEKKDYTVYVIIGAIVSIIIILIVIVLILLRRTGKNAKRKKKK
jgi:hypothetical protein